MKSNLKYFLFTSLRARLMLLVFLIIVPVLGLIVHHGIGGRNKERLEALDKAKRLARISAVLFENTIMEASHLIFTLSQTPQFHQQDMDACSKIFADLLKRTKYYSGFSVVKPNGDVFASAPYITKPVSFADRPWFQRLAQTRSIAIGEYTKIGRISGISTIVLGYPVLDNTGQLLAVFTAGLDLESLQHAFLAVNLPDGAVLTVIDNNGTILLRFPDPEKFVGKIMLNKPIVKAMLTKNEGAEEGVDLGGVHILYGYTTVGSGIEAIHISVCIPEQVAYADVNQYMAHDFTLLGLVSVLAIVGAWLFGKIFIISPVNSLIDVTKRLADGDLTVRSCRSTDTGELSLLALHFDQMADSLQRRDEQHKRAKETLRANEEKYRLITDSSNDWIYLTNPDGKFKYVSPSSERFTGYPSEEFINNQELFLDIIHADDKERVKSHLETVKENTKAHNLEFRIITREGELRWISHSCLPAFNDQGQYAGRSGTNREITERKRADDELKQTLERLRKAVGMTIQVMVSAVEKRDPYTAGHQVKSADIARSIAAEMGLPQEMVEGIRMAGSIHDIGKLSIPAEILSKPAKLSELEFSLIMEHPRSGYEILKDVESSYPLAEIVYQHHERMDGSGYPRNLKGDEILMEARILAVADVVEAMSSHRPYRPSLGIDAALDEIEKNQITLYDKTVADACLRLYQEKGFQIDGA